MNSLYYGGDECLRRMQMVATNKEIVGFFKCNVYKYVYRCTKKNDTLDDAKKDLGKAAAYMAELTVKAWSKSNDAILAKLHSAACCETWGELGDARDELLALMERTFRWE